MSIIGRAVLGEAATERVVLHTAAVKSEPFSTEAKIAIGLGIAVAAAVILEHQTGLVSRMVASAFPEAVTVHRYYRDSL